MSKRLKDDEKRFFTDQITMLKGENERLTKYIENQKDSLQDCEAEIEGFADDWKYNFEQYHVQITQLKAKNEDLREAGQELVDRVEQFTNEWSEDARPFLDLATSNMNDVLLTGDKEGFFCQKCGTVYTPEIMACRTCQPKAYAKLARRTDDG